MSCFIISYSYGFIQKILLFIKNNDSVFKSNMISNEKNKHKLMKTNHLT